MPCSFYQSANHASKDGPVTQLPTPNAKARPAVAPSGKHVSPSVALVQVVPGVEVVSPPGQRLGPDAPLESAGAAYDSRTVFEQLHVP